VSEFEPNCDLVESPRLDCVASAVAVRQACWVRASPTSGALVASLLLAACSSVFLGQGEGDAGSAADSATDVVGVPSDAKPSEDVDLADAGRSADAAIDAVDAADAAPPLRFRVFVTNATYDGKPGLGGLVGADDLCRQAATKLAPNDPTRRWMAYLAVNGQHPGARFADPPGGWVRIDGMSLFGSKADVVAGRLPNNPIALSELGVAPQGTSQVWTGMSNNVPSGNICNGWQSGAAAELGRVGNATRIDQSWQSDDNAACNLPRHLFCFEQPPA